MANELSIGWSCCFSGTEKEFHPKNERLGLHKQWFTSGDKQLEASVSPACFTAYSKVQRISRLQGLTTALYGVKAHRKQARLILSLLPGALGVQGLGMHMDLSSSHLEQEDAATRIVLMAEAGKCFVSLASEEVPPQSCKAKFYHGGTCSHNNPRSTGPAEQSWCQ